MALQQYRIGGTYYGYDPATKDLVAFPSMPALLQYFPQGIKQNVPTLPLAQNDGLLVTANQKPGQLINAATLLPKAAPRPVAPQPQPQATFYKPNPTNPQVYNSSGAPLNYDQYIAQGGRPDFSNVQHSYVPLQPQAAPTPPPPPTPAPKPNPHGLTGEYLDLYNEMKKYLGDLQKRGQIINPNVEITPEKVAEFTAQAGREIDPYYATQLKLAKDAFLSTVGYSTDQILNQERQLERKYATGLRTLGESAAEKGFALSGLRQRDERELALDTQEQIAAGRRQLGQGTLGLAQTFAQQYGGRELAIPSLAEAPQVSPGESAFARTGRSLPLYQLSPDIYDSLVGSDEFARRAAVQNRASQLEGAYRTTEANKQLRQLML